MSKSRVRSRAGSASAQSFPNSSMPHCGLQTKSRFHSHCRTVFSTVCRWRILESSAPSFRPGSTAQWHRSSLKSSGPDVSTMPRARDEDESLRAGEPARSASNRNRAGDQVMAERIADIVTQIQNVRQLGAVVTAMRGIAALRAQKGRSLLSGIEAYTDVVSRSIGQALNLLPMDILTSAPLRHAKRGLILFCAEQGFAGSFSERVFEAARGDLEGATTLVVGTRGAAVASERGIKPDWSAADGDACRGDPEFCEPAR